MIIFQNCFELRDERGGGVRMMHFPNLDVPRDKKICKKIF